MERAVTKARAALIAYLLALVAGTLVHDAAFLAVALVGVVAIGGRRAPAILRRAVLAVIAFNGVVTAAYVVLAKWQGTFSLDYVVLINLRVLLLTSLTFLFATRVNVFDALAFSPALTYVLAIAYGQIMTFQRVVEDFRLALRSRSIRPATLRQRYRQSAAVAGLLLDKSTHTAAEITHAMRARGFFDE